MDSVGLWNILPIYSELLANSKSILRTYSSFGNPDNYKQLISPMYCPEKDIGELLDCFGVVPSLNTIPKTLQNATRFLTIDWKLNPNSIQSGNNDTFTRIIVSNLTRLLIRYSVSPIQPFKDSNSKKLLEATYQYPQYTPITYVLCSRRALHLRKGTTKHLIDLALLNEQLVNRPFIKHRMLSMRIIGSSLIEHLGDAFLSTDLIIPLSKLTWRSKKISPLQINDSVDPNHKRKYLAIILLSSKQLVDEAMASQECMNGKKSNLFLWIVGKDEKQVQILDVITYNALAQFVSFLYPSSDFMAEQFTHCLLVDLNVYRVLCNPIKL